MNRTIILGTRSSKMALAVADHAKQLIEASHHNLAVEVQSFASLGDKTPGDLKILGGKGAFIKDLETRLLNREIDCAIHALKDIPGDIEPHPDLVLCSFLKRSDPRDALIMRAGLKAPRNDAEGLVIGTSAPRRQAQLKRLYEGVKIVPLRGNVDSRIRKLNEGAFDGIVVSLAGLKYLGVDDQVTKIYEPEEMLPAVGQGVLCVQVRREDYDKCSYLRSINSEDTEIAIKAEREMLRVIQGNCYSAIAGHCARADKGLKMTGAVFSEDGEQMICHTDTSQDHSLAASEKLGYELGMTLLNLGARETILHK